jgi:CheY-like chemotaxis protein
MLSNRIFEYFKDCPLQQLELTNVHLTDEWLPSSFFQGRWKENLTCIDLSNNKFLTADAVSSLRYLKNLVKLNLANCRKLSSLADMREMSSLRAVNLEGVKEIVVSSVLEQLPSSLCSLGLSHCRVSDDDLSALPRFSQLWALDLSHCEDITGAALSHIAKCGTLRVLEVNYCGRLGQGAEGLALLSSLESLSACFCFLDDAALPHLLALTGLTRLALSGNPLSESALQRLASLQRLQSLSLAHSRLTAPCLAAFAASLTALTSLNVSNCKLLPRPAIDKLRAALPRLQLENAAAPRLAEQYRPLVLLAEDGQVQARIIRMVLEKNNFAVELANDGKMALEMFTSAPKYDLIVMDVIMPVMDGLSTVRHIRDFERRHNLKRTPIIIQTADTAMSGRDYSEIQVDECLFKPLDKRLIALARGLVDKRKAVV